MMFNSNFYKQWQRLVFLLGVFLFTACETNYTLTVTVTPQNKNNVPYIPIYPQAKIMNLDVSHKDRRTLYFRTPDQPEVIFSFYYHELLAQGWSGGEGTPTYQGYRYNSQDILALYIYIDEVSSGMTNGRLELTYVGPGVNFPSGYPFQKEFQ